MSSELAALIDKCHQPQEYIKVPNLEKDQNQEEKSRKLKISVSDKKGDKKEETKEEKKVDLSPKKSDLNNDQGKFKSFS